MFSYIKGTLEEYWEDTVVIESGGIGWNIHVPLSVLDRLPHVGEQMKVYTSFQVKEDSMTLYGFLSRQDLKMFNQLLGVNGIGPKAALGILSSLTPDDLRMAIIAEDAKAIAKAPGIGPKTAKRVILDLKDKISMDDVLGPMASGTDLGTGSGAAAMAGLAEAAKEAVQALVALGYTNSEASRAVKQVEIVDGMTSEDVLKASLKHLSFL